MRNRNALIVVLLVVCGVQPFYGSSAAVLSYVGSGATYGVAWGDCDNDGDLDLAVGNWGDNFLYINDGFGNFTEYQRFGSRNTNAVVWGHFNNDTYMDVAVGNHFGPNAVYINNGDFVGYTFTEQLFGVEGGDTWSLAAADIDNDLDLDLAVGNWGNNSICLNNGNGTFVEAPEFGSGETCELAWGDYDDDLDLDLAVGNFFTSNLLYINNGDGTFTESQEFGSRYTRSLAWGDYDNDLDLDLAVGNQVQNALYINNGDGTFTEQLMFGLGDTWCVRWGDWNNDNYPDLAVGNDVATESGRESYVYINNQDGTFSPMLIGNDHIYSVDWGDCDNDLDEDIAVGVNDAEGENFIFKNEEVSFELMQQLFDTDAFFVAGDEAYCTDVLGSSKISFGLARGGASENPEGRTDIILTTTEHDTGNLIIVGGPAVNPVADEFDAIFGITYVYIPGVSFQIDAEGYSIFLDLSNYPQRDICIVYVRQHGLRNVMLVWGYGWFGTYAGSTYIGNVDNWSHHHLAMIRWVDSNADGLVQEDEVVVEVLA